MTQPGTISIERVQEAFSDIASAAALADKTAHSKAWHRLENVMNCNSTGELGRILTIPAVTLYAYVASRRFPTKEALLKIASDLNKKLQNKTKIYVPEVAPRQASPRLKSVSAIDELLQITERELGIDDSIEFRNCDGKIKASPVVASGLTQDGFAAFMQAAQKHGLADKRLQRTPDGKGIIIKPIEPPQ